MADLALSGQLLPAPIVPPVPAAPVRPQRRAALRRLKLRDGLWPDAGLVTFNPSRGGWTQQPRTLPMIAAFLDEVSGREKPGSLLQVLFSYDYGEGFIEVPDPARLALEAGYSPSRGERSFRERMRLLVQLGFVRASPVGTREFGYVLLLDPHRAVMALRQSGKVTIPNAWWSAFRARCAEVGIELPEVSPSV